MMELDFDDSIARGLRCYVRLVSRALGLRGDCSYVQADERFSAYLALDGRLSRFPDHDVALLWEEHRGWSAALETHSGADLHVVAYLGHDVLPPPDVVATWARGLFRPHREFDPVRRPDERPAAGHADRMRQRLAAYVDPEFARALTHRPRDADGVSLALE